ncbi:MAG: TetR family transcriptional regulator C-terminal domain-containing protein [Acidimicrobiales bacterium]
MSPAARREAIVDAALRVATRRGFGSTTVRDVAAELGCSSGLIHHYFDSMDDVLAAAFEHVAGRDLQVTETAVAGADGPVEQLLAFFDAYARTGDDWSFQLWLDAWAEASRHPALGATSRRLNVAWQRLLADIVERGVAAGVFRCDDPDGAAWRIVSMVDGLALQNVAHGPMLPENAILDWTFTTTEHELDLAHGTLARPSDASARRRVGSTAKAARSSRGAGASTPVRPDGPEATGTAGPSRAPRSPRSPRSPHSPHTPRSESA